MKFASVITQNSFGQRFILYSLGMRTNTSLEGQRLYVWGMFYGFGDLFVEVDLYKVDALDSRHLIYQWSYDVYFPDATTANNFFDSPWTVGDGYSNNNKPFNDPLNRHFRIKDAAGFTEWQLFFASPVDIHI